MKAKLLTIIGGGIHAITLAAGLAKYGFREFEIIDPGDHLGENLRLALRAQNLTNLRTSVQAHVDAWDPDALKSYAKQHRGMGDIDNSQIASVSMFNQHTDNVIGCYKLWLQHRKAEVTSLTTTKGNKYELGLDSGKKIKRKNVVIAIGLGNYCMPVGVQHSYAMSHSSKVHVNHEDWKNLKILIVGSGLTAANLAVQLAEKEAEVSLCCRGSLSISQTEADPLWLPEKPLHENFLKIKDPTIRYQMLRPARVGRGITPDVWQKLWIAIEQGKVQLQERQSDIEDLLKAHNTQLVGSERYFDRIICATGFESGLDKVPFLNGLMQTNPIANVHGLPILTSSFESTSHPGLFFSGRLAELQAGPFARNIPGAQYATRKIAPRFAVC